MSSTTRRRVIVALAALGVLAPTAQAKGASFWTIRPDIRNPLFWVGLNPPKTLPNGDVSPILAAPTGEADQHWSFRKSGHGYSIMNRQSGRCLAGDLLAAKTGEVFMWSCPLAYEYSSFRFNFHRPGTSQPVNLVSSGVVYQIRYSLREKGRERVGRCLVVPYSYFQPGGTLALQPCNRGQSANQRFLVKRFSAPR